MSLVSRLLGRGGSRPDLAPLYASLVAAAREPRWYRDAGVPDTLEGRFDMVTSMTTLALLRFEAAGEPGALPGALLVEKFVADMDGQLRESGIGDLVVGKHVGRMMGALGGKLGAYRDALAEDAGTGVLRETLVRNIYRGAPPAGDGADAAAAWTRLMRDRLARTPIAALVAGTIAP